MGFESYFLISLMFITSLEGRVDEEKGKFLPQCMLIELERRDDVRIKQV